MLALCLIGLVLGFVLAVYGNALRRPEMDKFFRKAPPENKYEEKQQRQANLRKGNVLFVIGVVIFVVAVFFTFMNV